MIRGVRATVRDADLLMVSESQLHAEVSFTIPPTCNPNSNDNLGKDQALNMKYQRGGKCEASRRHHHLFTWGNISFCRLLSPSSLIRTLQVMRTRLRQALRNNQRKYTGLIQCFHVLWKEKGTTVSCVR